MIILKKQKFLRSLELEADKLFGSAEKLSKKRPREITSKLREYLSFAHDLILSAHKDGAGGRTVCGLNSFTVDEMVRRLYAAFLLRRPAAVRKLFSSRFSIVATGGYGRRELCPKSDVDIGFLYDENRSPISGELKSLVIDEIMYPLWDTGLKLGHSSRNIAEVLEEAKTNILTRTSMLDLRHICGCARLTERCGREFKAQNAPMAAEHIDELFRLKRDRHAKYGWSPYVQEPNIKNGIGGLRDYQTISWMAQLKYGGKFRRLAEMKIVSTAEFRAMEKAYDFLLRVRNDMHYTARRPADLLDINSQARIARHLGFKQRDIILRSEKFMRKVYFCFRDIDNISKAARKRMKIVLPDDVLKSILPADINLREGERISVDGFWICNGSITPHNSSVFRKDPTRLIKVFLYCQKYGVIPSDKLEILIKDSIGLIDDSVRANESANMAFRSIMKKPGFVAPILERMHFWGVLGAFIKEFGELTCLVQHEFYHRYTADVHTLNTIAELDKVFRARVEETLYGDYHAAITSTQSPGLLYFIMLLHDIGKSDGIKGHAHASAEVSKKILSRFELPQSMTENALFVIENHLMMARFWQTHDVEDESAVESFADMVMDEEKLKYLYVMTFCDAKGTADDFWNSYKQSLHTSLYRGALRKLRNDETQIREFYENRKAKVLAEILQMEEFSGSEREVLEHFSNLPRNYFLFHGRDDLALHLRMIHTLRAKRAEDPDNAEVDAIFEWQDDPNHSLSKLCIVSEERKGLFFKICGAITIAGLNILSSKVLSRSDGITIDTFALTAIGGGPVANERMRTRFKDAFTKVMRQPDDTINTIEKIWKDTIIPFKTEARVKLSKASGAPNSVLIEVDAYDSAGLLFKVAKDISDNGFDIRFARINTERNWASDSFIAADLSGEPSQERYSKIAKDLAKMLSTDNGNSSAAASLASGKK